MAGVDRLNDASPEAIWKGKHVDSVRKTPYPGDFSVVKVAGKEPGPAHKPAELGID